MNSFGSAESKGCLWQQEATVDTAMRVFAVAKWCGVNATGDGIVVAA
jgi:hypothetical protein